MDLNKLDRLQTIGYKIHPSCELCINSTLSNDGWGTCGVYKYTHNKHTGERRQLSIHRSGYCSMFELDNSRLPMLQSFSQFLEGINE